jgi:4-oxalocrotonate tautomerase
MPIIRVDMIDKCSKEQKKEMIKRFTEITHKNFPIPADKIAVIITEIPRENFGQAGVAASEENYSELSRREKI